MPPPMMSCSVSSEPPGCRVTVVGEVDVATGPQLAKVLDAQVARATGAVYVDLAGVTFMDASGLHPLVDAAEALSTKGYRLILSRPSRSVSRLLQVTSMSRYFGLSRSDEEPRRS
jgi:anti-anti-sigma factor